jgi:outer membrane protein assembly factor BamB
MYCQPLSENSAGEEFTTALDLATGKTLWEQGESVKRLAKQESFGGAPIQPQSTPCVAGGLVFTVGYTGLLNARDGATGKKIWGTNLVADHGATPVQFGFATSPIVWNKQLIVHSGGKHAVMAFDLLTGKVLWASEAAGPSYATPVIVANNSTPFIVQQTRDNLLGLDPATGKTLWKYSLPKVGQTNVPTPVALSENRLLVSGQGWEGTRMLQLVAGGEGTTVKQLWYQRKTQFFYSNIVIHKEAVFGFPGNGGRRFTSLRLKDGTAAMLEAGYTDASLVELGDKLLFCRGDGLLSRVNVDDATVEVLDKAKPLAGRVWVTPTVLGQMLLVRSETELTAIPLSSLKADFVAPPDAGVTAMDEAFKPKPKK